MVAAFRVQSGLIWFLSSECSGDHTPTNIDLDNLLVEENSIPEGNDVPRY